MRSPTALRLFSWISLLLTTAFAASNVVSFDDCPSCDTLKPAIQNVDDCPSCLALLSAFQSIALTGDDPFITTLTSLCIGLGTADPDVCTGLVAREGPILAHDLRSISITPTSSSSSTAQKLCDALMGMCVTHPVTPFTVPFPKPAPAHPKVFKSRGGKPIRVAHLSDVHIDRMYTVGAEANCTKSICCRDFDDSPSTPPTVPALPNGNSHCDSPISLADSMLEEIERLNPRFSIFTGDVVEGATWLVDQAEVTTDLQAFDAQMAAKLSAPIFPSLGNDSASVNAFARTSSHAMNDSQFVFDTQSAGWEQWIKPAAAFEVKHHSGSYSAQVPGLGLRIVAVNTQYWYKQNFWLYDSDVVQPDPNGVLAFLVDALQAAEDAGDRAWIIGHIPLGKEDTMIDQVFPTWNLYYSARATYGPLVGLPPNEPLSPAFWHNLTEVFVANETAFQMFNTFISRGGAVTPCTGGDAGDCKNTTICDMRAFRSENNCVSIRLNFAVLTVWKEPF
ncbi:Metallo-dependent phosphatase-like protein [Favolaschia claudopus]|uniref:Metallo-dependent phosphatase-like protein n=1 Tax=Favolaschia claudopus TaxID=2862362 RepID=A0AAV9ZES6_9AGAR